jgi:peptide-methionine (S)-S-oxide reductase
LLWILKKNKMPRFEKAIFASGCFWHPEETYSNVKGVVSTQVGYIGGKTKNPTYANVCGGNTGHVEAVEITFDPEVISYEQLLNLFWGIHDPTSKDRQGPDVGSQYNSVIFYTNSKQKAAATKSKAEQQAKRTEKIVTPIRKAPVFWPAEEYHQRYMEKHGN